MSCSEIGAELEEEINFISVDGKEHKLFDLIGPNEEYLVNNLYSIESWILPKSISIDKSNCDFTGEGFGISLFFASSAPNFIDSGTYKIVVETSNPKKNEVAGELDFFSNTSSFEENLISGTVEVFNENKTYTIKVDAVTEKSKNVIVHFKGNLNLLDCF